MIRQPFVAGDLLPFWALGPFTGNHLFDLQKDPAEDDNLAGRRSRSDYADRLRQALLEIEAPDDHLERLGLA